MQLTAVERIARHRRDGVLRSDLSKTFNMDAKTFHYTATVSFDLLNNLKSLNGYSVPARSLYMATDPAMSAVCTARM